MYWRIELFSAIIIFSTHTEKSKVLIKKVYKALVELLLIVDVVFKSQARGSNLVESWLESCQDFRDVMFVEGWVRFGFRFTHSPGFRLFLFDFFRRRPQCSFGWLSVWSVDSDKRDFWGECVLSFMGLLYELNGSDRVIWSESSCLACSSLAVSNAGSRIKALWGVIWVWD